MRRLLLLFTTGLFSFTLVTANVLNSPSEKTGIVVMAHGGTPEWNAAVEEAVAPLGSSFPVRIAFGMAQPEPLQKAVGELEAEGVTHIAVVGLFVSSQSFRRQTEYLLGLRSDPPALYLQHHAGGELNSGHTIHMIPGSSAPSPIRKEATMLLNREGLYDSQKIGQIMVERVASLSTSPERESVLILAHGEGDNGINEQWVSRLDDLATQVRKLGPFRNVQVETLREDWQNQRAQAEQRIRTYVQQRSREGTSVLVVPFRVFGFGPYAAVLEGLRYVSDGRALLPHPMVAEWIEEQAQDCFRQMGIRHSADQVGEEQLRKVPGIAGASE
ncbi:hypothetical protein MYX82_09240 [Acidobacteria bacterium AH-259-D05]|nr:hypothetical protein [Acidobacteria bacterium AH-259-D05]